MTTPAFLTTPEVAELLRVSVATIARLTRRGELPHFHCHQQPEEGDEEMTTQAQHIRPGDVVRLAAVSGRVDDYRAPNKRDVARGKNNVLAKVHRVRIERDEEYEADKVRRSESVRLWVQLLDGPTPLFDFVCGAKAPIDLVPASERPKFPSDKEQSK